MNDIEKIQAAITNLSSHTQLALEILSDRVSRLEDQPVPSEKKPRYRYYVLSRNDLSELITAVNKELAEGWEVVGPMIPLNPGPTTLRHCQTLVQEIPEDI